MGLGSNLGDRRANLAAALDLLGQQVRITGVSALYETEPVGYADQPRFLNAVCEVEADYSPREMLVLANEVERRLGRVRETRYGPRTIDVDILLYDDLVLEEPDLQIPHPRMTERAFVLVPLAEVAADIVHPVAGVSIGTLRDKIASNDAHFEVHLWPDGPEGQG